MPWQTLERLRNWQISNSLTQAPGPAAEAAQTEANVWGCVMPRNAARHVMCSAANCPRQLSICSMLQQLQL